MHLHRQPPGQRLLQIPAAPARLARLRPQLTIREGLRRQDLLVEDRVEQSRSDIAQAEAEINESRARLSEIDAASTEADIAQQKELDGLRQTVADAQRNIAELSQHLALSKAVVAPADGRVTEVTTGAGASVETGAPMLTVETRGTGLSATVYVPIDAGKKIHPGMCVHVSPVTVRREEYGMLLGSVANVSPYPSTPQGMLAVLQNQKLVEAFAGIGSPYEASIELQAARIPTAYAWTSGLGPRIDLTSGTPVRTTITTQSDPPILLILPFLRPLFGDRG